MCTKNSLLYIYFCLYLIRLHFLFFPQDYGTLLCWASNEIGDQMEPCVYTITPAGKRIIESTCVCLWHCIVLIQPFIWDTERGVVNCFCCCYIMLIYYDKRLFVCTNVCKCRHHFSIFMTFYWTKSQWKIKPEMASVATDKQTVSRFCVICVHKLHFLFTLNLVMWLTFILTRIFHLCPFF